MKIYAIVNELPADDGGHVIQPIAFTTRKKANEEIKRQKQIDSYLGQYLAVTPLEVQ